MSPPPLTTSLKGERGLVFGIANECSIAAGCARAFTNAGAEIAATFLIDRAQAHIRAVTAPLGCELLLPCDVRIPGQLKAVFDRVTAEWGRLDFMLQAIAGSASTCMRKGHSA